MTGLSISVSLYSTPWGLTKLRRAPSWKQDLRLKPYRTHDRGMHTLSSPLSGTHSSWGKYIKHLIASSSTQGIILERISPARTYFVDSWRMNHRQREIIGQDKRRKKRENEQDRDPVRLQLAETQFCEWIKTSCMCSSCQLLFGTRAQERHAVLISVGLEATLLWPALMLYRVEINDMCGTFVV